MQIEATKALPEFTFHATADELQVIERALFKDNGVEDARLVSGAVEESTNARLWSELDDTLTQHNIPGLR